MLNGIWRGFEPQVANAFEQLRGPVPYARQMIFIQPGVVVTSDALFGQCAGDAVWEGGVRLAVSREVMATQPIPVPLLSRDFMKTDSDEIDYVAIAEYLQGVLAMTGNSTSFPSSLSHDSRLVVHSYIVIEPGPGLPATTVGPLHETRLARLPGASVVGMGMRMMFLLSDVPLDQMSEERLERFGAGGDFNPKGC